MAPRSQPDSPPVGLTEETSARPRGIDQTMRTPSVSRPAPRRRRPRRLIACCAGLAIVAGGLGGISGASAPQALTPPLSMTAETLPTWQTNGIVYAMAEADGVVFAGGTFSTI